MPFAIDNTPRLWVRYTSMGIEHEIMFRGSEAASQASMLGMAADLCFSMLPLMRSLDEFISARYSAKGSHLSFPAPWSVLTGTGTNDTVPGDPESYFIDWVARDTTYGARSHWTLFTGCNECPKPPTNRVLYGQNSRNDAVINALIAAATTSVAASRLTTISQGPAVVYQYANTMFSGYWQRKQRT